MARMGHSRRRTRYSSGASSTPSSQIAGTTGMCLPRRTRASSTCRSCAPSSRRRRGCAASARRTSAAWPLTRPLQARCTPSPGGRRLRSRARLTRAGRCACGRTAARRRASWSGRSGLRSLPSTRARRTACASASTALAALRFERCRTTTARRPSWLSSRRACGSTSSSRALRTSRGLRRSQSMSRGRQTGRTGTPLSCSRPRRGTSFGQSGGWMAPSRGRRTRRTWTTAIPLRR
mmetsp:Transcript_28378/g.84627  ORF Transcript_28378/g.84627 Transcript_28378/m.84627 type:complete len:235 (-) Transcript_28378:228-932(-)